jgi:DNA adenine methylase
VDSRDVAGKVLQWCKKNGENPLLRIVLAGYEGEHDSLESLGWRVHAWKAGGGYSSQGKQGSLNARRERLWFSPNCLEENNRQKELQFEPEPD